MILAAITANDITAFAALMATCLAIGGVVGRKWGTTKKQRVVQQAVEQAAENLVQQLTWSMTGKPADQWGPREPGLIEQMAKMREDQRAHATEDLKVAAAFHERLRTVEITSTAAAEALAKAATTTATALADRAGAHEITPDVLAAVLSRLDAIEHTKAS